MLYFENGKFRTMGITFAIPSGFCLNTTPMMEMEDGIEVVTPEENLAVIYEVREMNEDSTYETLSKVLRRLEDVEAQSIKPIAINGLEGHCVSYKDNRRSYFEAHFTANNEYALYFIAKSEGDVGTVPELLQAINTIAAE